MSDTDEITEAAAAGAAAAVNAVQDEQQVRDVSEAAADTAVTAAVVAENAAGTADMAAAIGTEAAATAQDAQETANAAVGAAVAASEDTATLREFVASELATVRQEMAQGWEGIREHLDRLAGPPNENDVQEVAANDESSGPADNAGTSEPANRGARHRFGRR